MVVFTLFWSILGDMARSATIKTERANGALLSIMIAIPTIVTP